MDSELQAAVDNGSITPAEASSLEKLTPGSYCLHKSWGFGRIAEWNLHLNQISIDFTGKQSHPMQPRYAAQTLQPLAENHILVRIANDPDAVRTQASSAPLELMRNILESHDGRATADQISQTLTRSLFGEAEYKRWWDSTKKLLKKDGHFELPAKRTDPVILRTEAVSRSSELVEAFNATTQLKTRLAAAADILKNPDAFDRPVEQLQPVIASLESAAAKNQKLNASQALESLIVRDELVALFPDLQTDSNLTIPAYLRDLGSSLAEVVEAIPAVRVRPLLRAFPATFGDEWADVALRLMPLTTTRTVGDIARTLRDQGELKTLISRLAHWIRERSITTDMLCWLCKERHNELDELVEPGLLAAIISSLERDQFSEKRSMRLHDMLIDDRELIGDILAKADRDAVREIMRRLMLSTVFEELTKRSLLARIIKLHPEMQALLTGTEAEEEPQQETLIVSWESLDARKQEYEHLIKVRIPENSKEIGIARSYGDLRENFEFKAAKEMQSVLSRRKSELELELSRARGTDYENADTSAVSIGTVVTVRNPDDSTDTYTILGAWDSNPEQHILSYLTAIGQALLGRRVGEKVSLPTEHGTREAEVLEIKPYKQAAVSV